MVTKNLQQVSTKDMPREEWLALRKNTIGGSDAAGIIGLSQYSTPYTVWADKTGRLPDKEDSEAMRLGRDLEDYVARRWMEATGKKCRRWQAMLYNPAYPFAHADIDRWVIGENAGLECKTTSTLDTAQFKGVEFPVKYYAQCVHYMAVTGADRWYLAVLVYGKGFFVYCLERDEAEIAALMAAEDNFWGYVATNMPPPVDGKEPTGEAITTIYAESRPDELQLFGREALLDEWQLLKEEQQRLAERIGTIENQIKADMGEAERGVAGSYTVSWKGQSRSTFQHKDFAADHPEIDLTPYFKTSRYRKFDIKCK